MMEKILDRFARSPLGRKLAADQQVEDLAQRRAWAAQLAQARVDFERERPLLLDALVQAEVRERALEAELAAARATHTAASLAVTGSSLVHDQRTGTLVRQLRVTADPRIHETKARLLARMDEARRLTQSTGPHPGTLNPVTLRAPEIWGSNAAENTAVVEAGLAACRQLDALELAILEPAELGRRLAEIERAVPAPTGTVPTPHTPEMTPAEQRAAAWDVEQAARR